MRGLGRMEGRGIRNLSVSRDGGERCLEGWFWGSGCGKLALINGEMESSLARYWFQPGVLLVASSNSCIGAKELGQDFL